MFGKAHEFFLSHKELISYAFFGVLTTLVNYAVYFPLYNYFDLSATLCNVIAWLVAVAFAFVTNKYCVFKSMDKSVRCVLSELLRFFGCRAGSGFVESVILLITVDILHWNGNVLKILTGIFVIIANYFGTKFLVFNKKDN